MITATHRFFYYFSVGVLTVAIFMGLYIMWLMFFDGNPPIEFNNQYNLKVIDKDYKAGDIVQIHSS